APTRRSSDLGAQSDLDLAGVGRVELDVVDLEGLFEGGENGGLGHDTPPAATASAAFLAQLTQLPLSRSSRSAALTAWPRTMPGNSVIEPATSDATTITTTAVE